MAADPLSSTFARSDPYVKVHCGDDYTESRIIHKTCNPKWNEVLELEGVLSDFVKNGLRLDLLDFDKGKADDVLGAVKADLGGLVHEDDMLSFKEQKVNTQGTISFSVSWDQAPSTSPRTATVIPTDPEVRKKQKGLLEVKVRHCSGLLAADDTGMSDPYVILTCGKLAKSSRVMKKTCDPKFNETLVLEATLGQLMSDKTLLKVR